MSSFFNERTTKQCLLLALRWDGVVRIPGFLQEELRPHLLEVFLEEAGGEPGFILERPCHVPARRHIFWHIAQELEDRLSRELQESGGFPFSSKRLRFNHVVGQRYLPGQQFGTHQDHQSFIDLVAIMVLEGRDELYLCDDKYGTNARKVESGPGDLLLMPAPGFYGSRLRPWHFVAEIRTRRTTLGFRHWTASA
jgi:hypothetical protein